MDLAMAIALRPPEPQGNIASRGRHVLDEFAMRGVIPLLDLVRADWSIGVKRRGVGWVVLIRKLVAGIYDAWCCLEAGPRS